MDLDHPAKPQPHIGMLHENGLHAELKRRLAKQGDLIEARVGRYVVDIVRGETLIEIQTKGFYKIKNKLAGLAEKNTVVLVHPIPIEKWILRIDDEGKVISRRKSPRKGKLADIFYELVRTPGLLDMPNLYLEVVMTQEEEVRRRGIGGGWRKKGWVVVDRRLVNVGASHIFSTSHDLLSLLPGDLPDPFTNRQAAEQLGWRISLAGKATHTLEAAGILKKVGKQGRANLFSFEA